MVLYCLRTDHQSISYFLICLMFISVHLEDGLTQYRHPLQRLIDVLQQLGGIYLRQRLIFFCVRISGMVTIPVLYVLVLDQVEHRIVSHAEKVGLQ